MNLIEEFNKDNHSTNATQRFEEFITFAQVKYDELESKLTPPEAEKSCVTCKHNKTLKDEYPCGMCDRIMAFNYYEPAPKSEEPCNTCIHSVTSRATEIDCDCENFSSYEPKPAPITAEAVLADVTGILIENLSAHLKYGNQIKVSIQEAIEAMKLYHEQLNK